MNFRIFKLSESDAQRCSGGVRGCKHPAEYGIYRIQEGGRLIGMTVCRQHIANAVQVGCQIPDKYAV